MYLFINTAVQQKITVGLIRSSFLSEKIIKPSKWQEAEKLLSMINQLFRKNKSKLENLQGVLVVKGPGGFTSLRIGVITANTIGYSLNIPVVGIRLGDKMIEKGIDQIKKVKTFKIVEPYYGRPPNITKPKMKK
ncbi:tRNA (adenosine(37)-N6)-threonylcarbamoyltransferase complex dimerization subunit type 1 TsaB [Patescibacteria group bacterium]|nr:tRNA (adenosine(37)-N6)-threonylcarbamoyltransferase complex dimerization subunit type 1 TsaB [Patescibacteria group bacterium]